MKNTTMRAPAIGALPAAFISVMDKTVDCPSDLDDAASNVGNSATVALSAKILLII